MRNLSNFAAASVLGVASVTAVPASADETLVMMRHAEKPADGRGQISCKGLNRALALPDVLLSRFGTPAAIYAPNPSVEKVDSGVKYAYVRPLATIEPTAVCAGLPVQVQWGFEDIKPLEKALLAPAYRNSTIFVAWEHKVLDIIARDLLSETGGDPRQVPTWSYDDFDTLYIIRIQTDASGKRRAWFEMQNEGLDGLAADCPKPETVTAPTTLPRKASDMERWR